MESKTERLSPNTNADVPHEIVLVPKFMGYSTYLVTCDTDADLRILATFRNKGAGYTADILSHAETSRKYMNNVSGFSDNQEVVLYIWPSVANQTFEIKWKPDVPTTKPAPPAVASISATLPIAPGTSSSSSSSRIDGAGKIRKRKVSRDKPYDSSGKSVKEKTKSFLKNFGTYQKKLFTEPMPQSMANSALTHFLLGIGSTGITCALLGLFHKA